MEIKSIEQHMELVKAQFDSVGTKFNGLAWGRIEQAIIGYAQQFQTLNADLLAQIETFKEVDKTNQAIISTYKNAVERLNKSNAEMLEMLEDMEKSWQSLPQGHNSVRDTQNWIVNDLHPQIIRMRDFVYKNKQLFPKNKEA